MNREVIITALSTLLSVEIEKLGQRKLRQEQDLNLVNTVFSISACCFVVGLLLLFTPILPLAAIIFVTGILGTLIQGLKKKAVQQEIKKLDRGIYERMETLTRLEERD